MLGRVPLHPNIVQIIGTNFDRSDCGGDKYLVEELLESNLADVLCDPQNPDGLSYFIILNICRDIARGLEHLQRNSVVHFDLKPQNILVDANLNAKIADFGSARVRQNSDLARSIGAGTFGYLAPEISPLFPNFVGTHIPMDKVDVYSLGIILLECITGKSPADSETCTLSEDITSSETIQDGLAKCYSQGFQVEDWCPGIISSLISDCTHFDYCHRISISTTLDRLEIMASNTTWENAFPARQRHAFLACEVE